MTEQDNTSEEGYAEALRRIRTASRNSDKELDLSDLGLQAVPPEITKLTALTSLYLWGNQLTSLLPEIARLTALTNLDLSNNQLTSLPSEIAKLTALTNLDFSDNQLTSLPSEIAKLTALTTFDLPVDEAAHRAAHELFAQAAPRETLDISLVIDTTGSMGDEISYLQAEFTALSGAIGAAHPKAQQRWSLVAYRDLGDDFVVQSFDFAPSLSDFQNHLAALSAGGGGDFPEAPDAALARTAELTWRLDHNTARLAFLVADAPHHAENAEAMAAAVQNLQALDVHVYPVASSGIDELTEITFRSVAQLTGGRYLFLTGDSGVGGEHKEPTIPCYYVTKLNDAISRMVDIELSGEYREPTPAEIVRTSDNIEAGQCQLTSGQHVDAY